MKLYFVSFCLLTSFLLSNENHSCIPEGPLKIKILTTINTDNSGKIVYELISEKSVTDISIQQKAEPSVILVYNKSKKLSEIIVSADNSIVNEISFSAGEDNLPYILLEANYLFNGIRYTAYGSVYFERVNGKIREISANEWTLKRSGIQIKTKSKSKNISIEKVTTGEYVSAPIVQGGGQPIQYIPPSPVQDETPVQGAGTINVYGHVTYTDKDGITQPLINAQVLLMDEDDTSGDDLLATMSTDWNGDYSFTNIPNEDCWGCGGADIYVRVVLRNTEFRGIISDGDPGDIDDLYNYRTSTTNNISNGTHQRNISFPHSDASQLFAAFNLGWNNAAITGQWPGAIYFRYPYGDGPGAVTTIDPPEIWIPGGLPDWTNYDDVTWHEYGHGLMKKAYGTRPDGAGGSHYYEVCYNNGMAWSEGFATFFTQTLNNDGIQNQANGDFPVEAIPSWYCEGQTNEARVAASCNDLWDYANDGTDLNSSYTVSWSTIWKDAMWGKRRNSFLEFYDVLKGYMTDAQKFWGAGSVSNNTIAVTSGDPSQPQNLSVSVNGLNHPVLSWSRNYESDVLSNSTGYQIWRRTFNGATWTSYSQHTAISGSSSTWTDQSIDNAGNGSKIAEYKIRASDTEGLTSAFSNIAQVNYGIYIDQGKIVKIIPLAPDKLEFNNYPNPFNPTTTVRFGVPEDTRVVIDVYDMLGRKISKLFEENVTAGYHEVSFDATILPSGMYLCKIFSVNGSITRKMLLQK